MNRGARRQAVFLDDDCCLAFLVILGDLPIRFGVRVHAYALMPNHFHLALECPVGGLARAMQYLQSRYARWLNVNHSWDGPIWRGRFRSRPVDDDAWWTHLLAYIHLNPVRGRLVADVAESRWSSHDAFVGVTPRPAWLAPDEPLASFGSVRTYREYLREVQVGREEGPDEFDAANVWSRPAPVVAAAPAAPLALADAWRALERVTGLTEAAIRAPGPPVNSARWLAMDWMPRASGLPRTEIARVFGVHPTAVSRAGARVRKACAEGAAPLSEWAVELDRLLG